VAALQRTAPTEISATVTRIESLHDQALVAAARALGGRGRDRMYLERALTLLDDMQLRTAAAQLDERIARRGPWPSTATQRVEAADLVLVLLVGIWTVAAALRRAAGLRRREDFEIERLTRAARADSLTGLGNHRAFQDDLAAAIERRNATGRHFSLLAFDLDSLKQVNDTRGHQAGDDYIRSVAGCIRDAIGDQGDAYRTGGDEFMAILPGARGWHALTVAHRIQREARRATGRRALSIGITESTATESRRVLLHQADVALYEAKRAKLLAISYHAGLELRGQEGGEAGSGPSQHQTALAAALARAVDAKDAGTRNHSETVAELCVAIGSRLGWQGERLERLRVAGLLHDVGKIGVSDSILKKASSLDAREQGELRLHATVGHSILTSAELYEEATWVLHHHERYDGAGYPAGLCGEAIPQESRIIAVADAFETMTGARPYRTSLSPEAALAELARHSGTQFDPACVHTLDAVFGSATLVPGEDELDAFDSAAATA
jgi:diguanylate cyclase (GGDEF)-like protein